MTAYPTCTMTFPMALPCSTVSCAFDDIGEWKTRRDIVDEGVRLQHARDVGDGARAFVGGQLIDQQELHRDVVDQAERAGELNLRPGAVDHQRAARAQHARQQCGIRREVELDHRVGAALRQRHHARADVLGLAVDRVVGTRLARDLGFLGRRHGGDHRRAARLGELDRIMRDRAGAARDQQRHAPWVPAMSIACQAVSAGMPKQAPAS